ncbi:dactylin [Anaeramoeba ignava]|uniref:Dactylin n=1 Tax=Anaeramoeba ignava TaxID=1746090 RepID=A0A9Q0R6X7_ANAIG|nr:dactylin [Anaeramoeba ignava]
MNPLHFFSSGTKEKKWVEIDNSPFKTKIYKQKGAMKIEKSDFELLKKGNYLNSTKNQKIPPEKENLILNQLPTEILLMICEYLSPGAFTNLGLTCRYFQDIFNDKQTWIKIAKSYQIFFIFDYFKLKFNFDERKYEILGFQTPLINEIDDIQIQNQSLDFPNLSQTHFQKLNQEREKRLKKYFNNNKIDDSTMKDENSNERKPVFNSTEEERIKYIKLLENPKEEMIEKARKIQHLLLKERIKIQNQIKYAPRREKFQSYHKFRDNHLTTPTLGCFFLGLTIYFFLIPLKINEGFYTLTGLNFAFFVPLFGFLILDLIEWILLIRTNLFKQIYPQKEVKIFFLRLEDYVEFLFLCIIFLIFLGLRIDGTIKWNYGIVFIPIYFNIILYYLPLFLDFDFDLKRGVFISKFVILPLIFIPFIILMNLYLEKKIENISYSFIPIYILLICLDIICFMNILIQYTSQN